MPSHLPTAPRRQVSAKRQKLLGLKTRDGRMAGDDAKVADLALKASTKVMMMGQREEVRPQARLPRARARVFLRRVSACRGSQRRG